MSERCSRRYTPSILSSKRQPSSREYCETRRLDFQWPMLSWAYSKRCPELRTRGSSDKSSRTVRDSTDFQVFLLVNIILLSGTIQRIRPS